MSDGRDILDMEAGVSNQFCCAARSEQSDFVVDQSLGEVKETGFVENGQNSWGSLVSQRLRANDMGILDRGSRLAVEQMSHFRNLLIIECNSGDHSVCDTCLKLLPRSKA